MHGAVWDELMGETDFSLPPDAPLTLVSYIGGGGLEAYIEPTAVGASLTEMPLFLTPEVYVRVPLEITYATAFEGMPEFWRGVLANSTSS
jgi:hypothetical protein